jgi:hypothetical protein
VVLHTGGNVYSNLDLWLHGHAEWQASSDPTTLIWKAGADTSFWLAVIALLVVATAAVSVYLQLARASPGTHRRGERTRARERCLTCR